MRMNGENLAINGKLFEVILKILGFYFAPLRLCGKQEIFPAKTQSSLRNTKAFLTVCYF